MNKQEIKNSYYYTDIEPQLEVLQQIIKICDDFEKDGGDKLAYALEMRRWNLEQISHLSDYIMQARHKMEEELKRLKRLGDTFNHEFATDHNGCVESAAELLRRIRSHTSPLKNILKRFCTPKHPNRKQCQRYNIKSKSVMDESALARNDYQRTLFQEYYPQEVKELLNELNLFFAAEKQCMKICTAILKEEAEIRKSPERSKCILDMYRKKAYEKLKNQIMLITDDAIEMLIELSPAYQKYSKFANDEGFAQEEFHRHNTADMDHFCLIEFKQAERNYNMDAESLAMWGRQPDTEQKVKMVIERFDTLLPDDFTSKHMGEYMYYFCRWAHPDNIKQGVAYFTKRYKGQYRVVKYNSVNAHKDTYDPNAREVKNFINNINKMLNSDQNLKKFSAGA